MKIVWKSHPKPKDSGELRGWPYALYENGKPAAIILCTENYDPTKLNRKSKPFDLTLHIANHSIKPWKWDLIKSQFLNLSEAKESAQKIIDRNPELWPIE